MTISRPPRVTGRMLPWGMSVSGRAGWNWGSVMCAWLCGTRTRTLTGTVRSRLNYRDLEEIAPGNFLGAALERDFRLEDRHRLADDPDGLDGAVLDFELHVHAPRPVQMVPLHT